jgi:hypothetical protein
LAAVHDLDHGRRHGHLDQDTDDDRQRRAGVEQDLALTLSDFCIGGVSGPSFGLLNITF